MQELDDVPPQTDVEEDTGAAAESTAEATADTAVETGTSEKAGYSEGGGGYTDVTDKKAYNEYVHSISLHSLFYPVKSV